MGQFTKDIKQKNGIEERKQQAKEHRKQKNTWKYLYLHQLSLKKYISCSSKLTLPLQN